MVLKNKFFFLFFVTLSLGLAFLISLPFTNKIPDTSAQTGCPVCFCGIINCDIDGDGYMRNDSDCGGTDCNDNDLLVHPGAIERCDPRGVDNDCDNIADEGCSECDWQWTGACGVGCALTEKQQTCGPFDCLHNATCTEGATRCTYNSECDCSDPCPDPSTKTCGTPISPFSGCMGSCPPGTAGGGICIDDSNCCGLTCTDKAYVYDNNKRCCNSGLALPEGSAICYCDTECADGLWCVNLFCRAGVEVLNEPACGEKAFMTTGGPASVANLGGVGPWNDSIYKIKISPGWQAVLWKNNPPSGSSTTLNSNSNCYGIVNGVYDLTRVAVSDNYYCAAPAENIDQWNNDVSYIAVIPPGGCIPGTCDPVNGFCDWVTATWDHDTSTGSRYCTTCGDYCHDNVQNCGESAVDCDGDSGCGCCAGECRYTTRQVCEDGTWSAPDSPQYCTGCDSCLDNKVGNCEEYHNTCVDSSCRSISGCGINDCTACGGCSDATPCNTEKRAYCNAGFWDYDETQYCSHCGGSACGDGKCNCGENSTSCPGDCTITSVSRPLVPCGLGANWVPTDPTEVDVWEDCSCTFCHLFTLLFRIIDTGIKYIIIPLAVLFMVFGGILFVIGHYSAENPALITQARKLVTAVFIGLLIILAAWVIVNTLFSWTNFISTNFTSTEGITWNPADWFKVECAVPGGDDPSTPGLEPGATGPFDPNDPGHCVLP